MNEIRLSDDCPVWEGACYLGLFGRCFALWGGTDDDGPWLKGVDEEGCVYNGEPVSGCVLDLTHRPTFFELCIRTADLLGCSLAYDCDLAVLFHGRGLGWFSHNDPNAAARLVSLYRSADMVAKEKGDHHG